MLRGGDDYVEPHVVLIRNTDKVFYKQLTPPPPAQVGDIAYWNESSVKTTPLSSWNTSLGTPVGVVMIPENFLPDGKARIISLNYVVYNGSEDLVWDSYGWEGDITDSPAPNFNNFPTTDNAGSTSTGSFSQGCLPSDRTDSDKWISGTQSYVDPLARYNSQALEWGYYPMIPSPYIGEEFNPAYSEATDGGNALSDFNGLSNTQLLVSAGTRYAAAHACWNYKDAANSNLQWYLPAMGELGFLMARYELINTSIQAIGGTPVEESDFWSSSEKYFTMDTYGWTLGTNYGSVILTEGIKNYENYVRSVCLL